MTERIRNAMAQEKKEAQPTEWLADGLEPYRQLIELQKQMIELVREYEKTKCDCAALRGRLMEEMARERRLRRSLSRGIGRSAAGWLKDLASAWRSRVAARPRTKGSFSPNNAF